MVLAPRVLARSGIAKTGTCWVARMINLLLAYRDDRGAGGFQLLALSGTCWDSYLSLSDHAKSANIEVTASALALSVNSIFVKIYPLLQQLLQALDLRWPAIMGGSHPRAMAKLELKR